MIEYKVVTLRNYDAVDSDDLNVLAKDGWRAVTCCYITGEGVIVIMSREQATVFDPPWKDADRPLPQAYPPGKAP